MYRFMIFYFILSIEGYCLCVTAKKANLRKGPGTNHALTWEVYKFMPLRLLSKKGTWYQVKDLDGDIHWIHSSLVTDSYKCAVVKTKKANVRVGPGTNYKKNPKYPTTEKYVAFKYIKTNDKWARVMDYYGNYYWIYRSLLWIN